MHQRWLDPLRPRYRTRRDGSISAEARATSHPLTVRAAQGPARWRRSQPPERYYVGRRLDATEVYIVSRAELEPLPHLNYQSGEAFAWGCSTAGALELAFAMLASTTETRPTDVVCRTFCAQVVACLDPAGFVVSHGDIALWLMIAFSDAYIPPREQSPEDHGRMGRRAARWIRSWLRRP
jgi:hypothetical protein